MSNQICVNKGLTLTNNISSWPRDITFSRNIVDNIGNHTPLLDDNKLLPSKNHSRCWNGEKVEAMINECGVISS